MTLYIDTREPASLVQVINEMIQDTRIITLQQADFALFDQDGCSLGIERKTWTDLVSSFGSGRLEAQLGRISAGYTPLLLIEGSLSRTKGGWLRTEQHTTGWRLAAVTMALLALQDEHGLRFLYTPDHYATADCLRLLHQRSQLGCWRHSVRETRKLLKEERALESPSLDRAMVQSSRSKHPSIRLDIPLKESKKGGKRNARPDSPAPR